MTQHMVIGFLFSPDEQQVALIQKLKPEWQRGRLNGIGGKQNPEDGCPSETMEREFYEETEGVDEVNWKYAFSIDFEDVVLHVFKGHADIELLKSREAEQIEIVPVAAIWSLHTIYNLRWMLPLLLDKSMQFPIQFTGISHWSSKAQE